MGQRDSETLDQYLKRIRLPEYFVKFYLLPLMSSVTTCPHESLLAFPASDVVDYKRKTHGAPHYTVLNGVKTVQDQLVQGIEHELNVAVFAVMPEGNQVTICWNKIDGSTESKHQEVFDRVILAVAPDIVGEIFKPVQYHMTKIPTTLVESVVHTDRTVLDEGKALKQSQGDASAQLIYLRTATSGTQRTESLHVQPCGVIVTTCPFSPIDTAVTLHAAKFTRVLRSLESRRIVNGIFEDTPVAYGDEKARSLWKNGEGNVWLVGGWCWDGLVLLEGCVVSAMRVADAFGVDVPWRH